MQRVKGISSMLIVATLLVLSWDYVFPQNPILQLPYPIGESWVLTRGYESGDTHNGIDKYALDFTLSGCGSWNKPILASAGGTVQIKSMVDNGGYGIYLTINHGNGYETLYGHIKEITVNNGQIVKMGDQIGRCGNTGHAEGQACPPYPGTHLHYRITKNSGPVKPEPLSGYSNFDSKEGTSCLAIPLRHQHGSVLRTQSNPDLYLIENGQKHKFESFNIWVANGQPDNLVLYVSQEELNGYLTGNQVVSRYPDYSSNFVRDPSDQLFKISGQGSTVWLFDSSQGKKRKFVLNQIYSSWKYSGSIPTLLPSKYPADQPAGEQVYFRDGTLIKGSAATIYVISQGYARPFESQQVIDALGYKTGNIISLPQSNINNKDGFIGFGETLTATNIWQENYNYNIAIGGSGGDDGSGDDSGSGSGSGSAQDPDITDNFPLTVKLGSNINSFPATLTTSDFAPANPLEGAETGIKLTRTDPKTNSTKIFWVGSSGWWKVDLNLKALRFTNDGDNPQWPEVNFTFTHRTKPGVTVGPFAAMSLNWANYTAYINVVQTGEYILELTLTQSTINKSHTVYFDRATLNPAASPGSPAVPPANPSLVGAPPPVPTSGTTVRFYVNQAGDGYVSNYWGSWSTIRNAALGGGAVTTQTIADGFGSARYDQGNGGWGINRGIFGVNTSSIPDNATITRAVVGLWFEKRNGASNDSYHIVAGTQASLASLSATDYNKVGSTSFASFMTGQVAFIGYTVVALNEAGMASINKTGETKFAARLGCDLNNVEPTKPFECGLRAYMFEYGSRLPYLDITYEVADVPVLAISAATLEFNCSGSQTFNLTNAGVGTLTWGLTDNAGWLTCY